MSLARLTLHSEPYGSTGNIGPNLKRLLGTPALDPLQALVRESVQNIADAARLGVRARILFRIRTLRGAQRTAIKEHVLTQWPEDEDSNQKLQAFLTRENPVVMEICDFGTVGLGGPTRADRIPEGDERTDFIDLLRNVGSPRDVEHGGGTYGFGKAVLYRASRCRTILVDSLVTGGGEGARRFIASHIGRSFQAKWNGTVRPYTGRHWWGVPDNDNGSTFVEPLLDVSAEELAAALGLPCRSAAESGTSIMILDFDLQEVTPETAGWRVVETLLWNFWPRMLSTTPEERRFDCRVEVDGRSLAIPEPEQTAPLHLFAKAMDTARTGCGEIVRSERPRKNLGTLAIEKDLCAPRHRIGMLTESVLPKLCRHIALMRPVELVVKYLEGEPLPDDRVEWAGVFLAAREREVERAFARAEPPAHNSWEPTNLPKGRAKSFVNVALTRLRRRATDMGQTQSPVPEAEHTGPPLARTAGLMGRVLGGTIGDGGRDEPTTNETICSRGRGRRPTASRPLFVRLERDNEGTIAVFRTTVRQDQEKNGRVLRVNAAVVMDGRKSNDPSLLQPTVLGLHGSTPVLSANGNELILNGAEGEFDIRVRMPEHAAATVDAFMLAGPVK